MSFVHLVNKTTSLFNSNNGSTPSKNNNNDDGFAEEDVISVDEDAQPNTYAPQHNMFNTYTTNNIKNQPLTTSNVRSYISEKNAYRDHILRLEKIATSMPQPRQSNWLFFIDADIEHEFLTQNFYGPRYWRIYVLVLFVLVLWLGQSITLGFLDYSSTTISASSSSSSSSSSPSTNSTTASSNSSSSSFPGYIIPMYSNLTYSLVRAVLRASNGLFTILFAILLCFPQIRRSPKRTETLTVVWFIITTSIIAAGFAFPYRYDFAPTNSKFYRYPENLFVIISTGYLMLRYGLLLCTFVFFFFCLLCFILQLKNFKYIFFYSLKNKRLRFIPTLIMTIVNGSIFILLTVAFNFDLLSSHAHTRLLLYMVAYNVINLFVCVTLYHMERMQRNKYLLMKNLEVYKSNAISEKQKSELLLYNILPEKLTREYKAVKLKNPQQQANMYATRASQQQQQQQANSNKN